MFLYSLSLAIKMGLVEINLVNMLNEPHKLQEKVDSKEEIITDQKTAYDKL